MRAAESFLRASFGTHPCRFDPPTRWKRWEGKGFHPFCQSDSGSHPVQLLSDVLGCHKNKWKSRALKRFEWYRIVFLRTTRWHQHSRGGQKRTKKNSSIRDTEKGINIMTCLYIVSFLSGNYKKSLAYRFWHTMTLQQTARIFKKIQTGREIKTKDGEDTYCYRHKHKDVVLIKC